MLLLLAVACTDDINAGKLAGTTVTEAWIDDFAWGSFTMVGGVAGGEGTLKATTVQGEIIRQQIGWVGGVGGFGLFTMFASGGRVDYQLPEPEMPGEALFGAFDGSLEAIAAGAGYQSLHLRSERHVELDSEGLAAIFAVGVAAVSIDLYSVDAHKPESLDTGTPWSPEDSGDTADSDDTEDPGDTADSDDTADTAAAND